ncbi:MAG: 50S ribosomal protein L25 [Patescibacteria group bacterium]|nr:50S ribosomal protein L25 [Patescibacteria group bacterium]
MITNFKIIAEKRNLETNKLTELRAGGSVPGIVYGNKISPLALYFNKEQAELIKEVAGKATVIPLTVKEEKKTKNVIVQELQWDKLSGKLIHIDLYEIDMKKQIETEIPLYFEGTSAAVRDMGGTLVRNIEEIFVKCLPVDLPEKIVVDVSILKTFDDIIYIKDLDISDKVEVFNSPEDIIAKVSKPRSEKELEELDESVEGDVSQVEGVEDKDEKEIAEEGKESKDTEDTSKDTEEKSQTDKADMEEETKPKKEEK